MLGDKAQTESSYIFISVLNAKDAHCFNWEKSYCNSQWMISHCLELFEAWLCCLVLTNTKQLFSGLFKGMHVSAYCHVWERVIVKIYIIHVIRLCWYCNCNRSYTFSIIKHLTKHKQIMPHKYANNIILISSSSLERYFLLKSCHPFPYGR